MNKNISIDNQLIIIKLKNNTLYICNVLFFLLTFVE